MNDRRNGGWRDGQPPPPYKRSYAFKCPYPGCGLGFGSKRRVGEHLENVHHIWPTDGIYKIPRRAPHDL